MATHMKPGSLETTNGYSHDERLETRREAHGGGFFAMEFFFRVLAVGATLAAAIVMSKAKQTETVPVAVVNLVPVLAPVPAKYHYSPAFVYFVVANAVACGYTALSILASFSKLKKSSVLSTLLLAITDLFPLDCEEGRGGLQKLHNHSMVTTVREACEKWGFFRVVNTGIPTDLLKNVENVSHELCEMPAEVKTRAITSNPFESYNRSSLIEGFVILKLPHSDSFQELSAKIWPEKGNPNFRETIETYTFAMVDLQRKITKVILASLGLDVNTFYHSDFQDCTAYMRINHYFSDGKSTDEEEALFAHTDITCFTILYQDNEGGLQIRSSEGKWLNVKPISSSFVVNVADSLKAWSNGRYRSVEHRVINKGWTDRLSLAWFVHFPYDKEICAPPELVDDHHPRRYRPFTFSQSKQELVNIVRSKQKNPTNLIHCYAGISFDDSNS